ncbi:type IV pilin [Haloarcula amylovorans]|uniref:type IV pilin n=1 Tax=Haloarcula amylovorans TaxID=2562280 RepID=UPI001076668F|nr:type IV pilin N-terminal domain-containing protein [Halomicroarcula amylolytica]
MDLKELLQDDDAVSPVIGVILMVAITVILAAVIASFVLGLGDQAQKQTPQASFSYDYDESVDAQTASNIDFGTANFSDSTPNGALTITHDGGDTINENRLSLVESGGDKKPNLNSASSISAAQDITAGTSIVVGADSSDEVRVIFTSTSGDNTATLSTWTGPDA